MQTRLLSFSTSNVLVSSLVLLSASKKVLFCGAIKTTPSRPSFSLLANIARPFILVACLTRLCLTYDLLVTVIPPVRTVPALLSANRPRTCRHDTSTLHDPYTQGPLSLVLISKIKEIGNDDTF